MQGEQHRTFIERFHVDQEGFEYQLKKDVYKKEFAIRNGYKLVEIWYEDIENGKFKDIINAAIDEKPCTSLIRWAYANGNGEHEIRFVCIAVNYPDP